MNILIYGDDKVALRDKLISLRQQFKKMYPDGDVVVLYGDNLPDIGELVDVFSSDSLFGNKKLIVFKDFPDVVSAKKSEEILPWLLTGGERHTIIYYAEDNSDAVKLTHIQDLKVKKLLDEKYIYYCRKGRGAPSTVALTPEQRIYIDQVFSQDSALASQELAKAELLHRAGHAEMVNQVFNDYHVSMTVFPFIDSMFARDSKRATSLLRSLLDQGENELMLLTMLMNHLKKIIFILDAEAKHVEVDALLKKMRVHAFVAKKMLQQKRTFSLKSAQLWLAKLLEIDLLAKQGKVDPKVALNQFCVSIES